MTKAKLGVPDRNEQSGAIPGRSGRCLRFDRRFSELGVPRIQRSSGTYDPSEFARRNDLLTRIANARIKDLLEAFSSGEVSIGDLLRLSREENLRDGLKTLREERGIRLSSRIEGGVETTSSRNPGPTEGMFTSPVTISDEVATKPSETPVTCSSELARTASSTNPWAGLELNLDFSRPLWFSFRSQIAQMLDVVSETRRRYLTSLDSLQLKVAACAATEEQFQQLAGISPAEWEALALARRRGLEVTFLRTGTGMSVARQRALLNSRNLRMSTDVFAALRSLTEDQWTTLAEVADLPITEQIVRCLDEADSEDRQAVRRLASVLSPDATVGSLAVVRRGEWHALSRVWGASGSDWNHVRRALSSCLTRFIGTDRHLFRQTVIDNIPLLEERERIPDITLDKLGEVSRYLPEHVRHFAWFIVLSGCRISEYLRLDRHNLKPNVCMIDIPGRKTADSLRSIHVAPALWWVADAAVPCHLRYRQLREHWVAACERAGVFGVTIHDLRHVCGQSAADAGVKLEAIQAHLGHSNPEMALKYAQRRELKKGSEVLGSFLSTHLQPKNENE